ncbi:hypothetical protein ANN_17351 [Periplaneta americana]|uniref:Reverse transcriptase domain-containing protein n=1 Tax=Periplaneta americana TaxID=6978 RepID=A0ABQ8SSQ7_PERAM|nr:hypothetical protein ANN_17351 [Periplaneta americana]
MAGLCEGGNEPSGSLKAICKYHVMNINVGNIDSLSAKCDPESTRAPTRKNNKESQCIERVATLLRDSNHTVSPYWLDDRSPLLRDVDVRASNRLLEYNVIQEVEGLAFNGSQVAKLSLKGNRALTTLHPNAFVGVKSLRYLSAEDTPFPTKSFLDHSYPPFDFLAEAHVTAHSTPQVFEAVRLLEGDEINICYDDDYDDGDDDDDGDGDDLSGITFCRILPISILPTLSKALEHIVHGQLMNYLDEHKLLDDYQSGFRHGHSTSTALLKVTEDIREAMDRGEVTALTLLDFSNAFGSVDIDLLLAKMKALHLTSEKLGSRIPTTAAHFTFRPRTTLQNMLGISHLLDSMKLIEMPAR